MSRNEMNGGVRESCRLPSWALSLLNTRSSPSVHHSPPHHFRVCQSKQAVVLEAEQHESLLFKACNISSSNPSGLLYTSLQTFLCFKRDSLPVLSCIFLLLCFVFGIHLLCVWVLNSSVLMTRVSFTCTDSWVWILVWWLVKNLFAGWALPKIQSMEAHCCQPN